MPWQRRSVASGDLKSRHGAVGSALQWHLGDRRPESFDACVLIRGSGTELHAHLTSRKSPPPEPVCYKVY